MQKRKIWLAAMALSLVVPAVANSAELNIEFEDADSYADIQPGERNRSQHQSQVLEGFEGIFTDLAQQLPDDQVLHIKVTDIDLAGYVTPVPRDGGLYMMRIVRHGHDPSIRFEYRLVDSNDQVVGEGEESLRGRTANDSVRQSPSVASESLRHERDMLERWFRSTFDFH